MREYYEFPKFCEQVGEAFRQRKFISKRDLNRKFFRHMRQGYERDRVVTQLVSQGLIEWAEQSPPTDGTTAKGWKLVEE
jgi:hypothetical protein